MLFSDRVFVGIDPTAASRPMHYVALNADLEIITRDRGDLEHVLAFLAGLERAVVAINAPSGPNLGLMRQETLRRRYNLRSGRSTWVKWRVCEVDLRRRNIHLYNTPGSRDLAAGWVQQGFSLFARLQTLGYRIRLDDAQAPDRALLEVQPHAAFTALLERRPFPKHSLEGRLQRQLVLYLERVEIPNPLQCLEEVTRHHLLSGHLPLDDLHTAEELDALVAAFTAYCSVHEPGRITRVGEQDEGVITLPVASLRDHYPSE